MKKIAGIISRSLDVHFSEEDQAKYSRNEMRKIALVNYIALIAIVNMLSYVILYSILDFPLFKPAILFLTLASIPIVGIIFINKKGKHLLAKILVCTFNAFNMSYIAIVAFEKEPEFQVYLLLGAIIPIFLWSYKQRTYPIIIISLILGVYGFIEFFPPLFEAQIILPENYIHGFRLSNVFICFLAVAAAIGFYQFLYRKQEELLHQQAEQLKISQQHKDLIYSIIAHDIRSPFGNLAGLAEVLKEKYEKYSDAERLKVIGTIHNSSNAIQGLLENLLDWSKIQTGRLRAAPTEIKLRNIAEESIAVHHDMILKKELQVKLDIDTDAIAFADKHMVSTIFRNLISNAIKFSADKGKITITSSVEGDVNQICVEDQGIGISETAIKELFATPNFDLVAKSAAKRGSGLGLLLCYDFAIINKGEIWVESEVNKGSKFFFTLPQKQ